MRFIIAPEIFTSFPGLRIVTAVALGLKPASSGLKTDAFLDAAWQSAGRAVAMHENAQSHPNIKPWGERMKAVGAPRKHFPCSVEALARRAGKGGSPVRVSPLVDFYNAISLKYLVPAGGFDLNALKHDLLLRFSRAGDTFTALDSDETVDIPVGEVSYADGTTIITRHFVWKQSRHAIIDAGSKNIFFVAEILGDLPPELAENVRAAFAAGLRDYFGIKAETAVLDATQPFQEIAPPAS